MGIDGRNILSEGLEFFHCTIQYIEICNKLHVAPDSLFSHLFR